MTTPRKCVGGVTVSIVAFQTVDLGSVPGRRKLSKVTFFTNLNS